MSERRHRERETTETVEGEDREGQRQTGKGKGVGSQREGEDRKRERTERGEGRGIDRQTESKRHVEEWKKGGDNCIAFLDMYERTVKAVIKHQHCQLKYITNNLCCPTETS